MMLSRSGAAASSSFRSNHSLAKLLQPPPFQTQLSLHTPVPNFQPRRWRPLPPLRREPPLRPQSPTTPTRPPTSPSTWSPPSCSQPSPKTYLPLPFPPLSKPPITHFYILIGFVSRPPPPSPPPAPSTSQKSPSASSPSETRRRCGSRYARSVARSGSSRWWRI